LPVGRDHLRSVMLHQWCVQPVAVIGFVADQVLRPPRILSASLPPTSRQPGKDILSAGRKEDHGRLQYHPESPAPAISGVTAGIRNFHPRFARILERPPGLREWH
jgi:hypothetical protein